MNNSDNGRDNIFVLVRIRPPSEKEMREGGDTCVRVEEGRQNAIILETKPEPKVFTFDWVAPGNTSQENVFEGVGQPLVTTCLQGKENSRDSAKTQIYSKRLLIRRFLMTFANFRLQLHDSRLWPN